MTGHVTARSWLLALPLLALVALLAFGPLSAHVLAASPTPAATASPAPSAGTSGNSPDILKYALLTIGAAGAAGAITFVGYFVRRAIGYEPHRPTADDDTGHH